MRPPLLLLTLAAVLVAVPALASDFADGLKGGPDAWRVSGLGPGATLALRTAPARDAAILARYPDGTRLANEGCLIRKSVRWCRVSPWDARKPSGWVIGRDLREATD
ncbi:SH3 domain-containing protein [Xanthobacter sediminis]|uniref:hypothetical protein n=1 Tax=Xanthobacter sediminis TaxID=3119926 RepID=UPI0037267424